MIRADVTGLVLAGGRGQRMGGRDKGLVRLGGQPMAARVIEALAPQVASVIVNANRNLEEYRRLGSPVVSDAVGEFAGPLAGMLSGLEAATTRYVVTVPCDSPLIGPDLVARLHRRLVDEGAEICTAHDGERTHPVFALVERRLAGSLAEFLAEGERKIDRWFARHATVTADFSDVAQSLANVNDSAELAAVASRLGLPAAGAGTPPVVGFAAYSGTGKTTALRAVIAELRRRGFRVGVIKHAHHLFDVDQPGKDSYELRKAGARQTLVSSARRFALVHELLGEAEPDLPALVARLELDALDIVLVEGFKHAAFPKIEVRRSGAAAAPLSPADPNVVAIATDDPAGVDSELPVLDLRQPDDIAQFIAKVYLT